MKFKTNYIVWLSIFSITLSGCSSLKTSTKKRDPFENYNRKMYSFNDTAYKTLTPAANAYNKVVPDTLKSGIFNIFNNLAEPARVVNDMFQGEWDYAGDDSVRFLTNTTLGIAGYFDVADSWFSKPMRYHQSFAVTLHKWGAYGKGEASPYVVWPLLGPGTLEDVTKGVDALFNPLTYVFFFAPIGAAVSWGVTAGITGSYYVNQGVSYLPAYSNLKEVSIDPYIAMRNAYLQNYDYGMARVLKQDLRTDDATLQTDQAVLGVLGLDNDDVASQVASTGGPRSNKKSQPPVLLKSSLDTINKATQVEEEFDQAYSNDSTAIDLANVDKDNTTQSEASKIKTQIRDTKAALPGDANSLPSSIQTLKEQG
ncbi:lipoprotein [Francisella halioticida]|uniref:ABC transporter n=1 Tax=Francisella halioticida TaxID=549298 RepID=A0ABM6LXR6_9GAMM|nr:VacJ family lipoprotein [Francisella halioticida]ASG67323.1 ABC transporter [Francisella halioticida]BCD92486.1 lipoprotein [Francisella halioticida]